MALNDKCVSIELLKTLVSLLNFYFIILRLWIIFKKSKKHVK